MLPNASPCELEAELPGRVVRAIERRGKYLVMRLDRGALVVHRRMTGNLILRPPEGPPAPHTHLVISFDDGQELHFVDPRKFGRVYYFRSGDDLAAFLAARLGPEPLGDLTPEQLAERLQRRGGRLKPLLLDQAFLAGLGNLYTDEALWLAGLHPLRVARSLTRAEAERLHAAMVEVLEAAIRRRGTSLSDYRDAEGVPGENQHHLRVYGRHGQPCARCGANIQRQVVVQRGTWTCPVCQPLSP